MAKKHFSAKKLAIDKSNASTIVAMGIAAFVSVFCLVASKSLLDQRGYQAKVESKKTIALKQLKSNIKSVDQLVISYQEFAGATENVLGGNPKGNADRDGENPRIVLDALPSKYDFPALTTSIEKMLKDNNFVIDNITGTDDEVAQATTQELDTPQPVEMPFSVEALAPQGTGKQLLRLFERSIRPIQIQKLIIDGQGTEIKFTITAKTYFQPEKSLGVRTELVR